MITINDNKITSKYLTEEYFPIKVQFSNYELESIKNYVRFDYDDSNALELSFNKNKPYNIVELNLLTTNRFNVIDENYTINIEVVEGTILSKVPEKYCAKEFAINVYNNIVEIKLSYEAIDKSIKCGAVIFNFTTTMDLVSIVLTEISSNVKQHIVTELEYSI